MQKVRGHLHSDSTPSWPTDHVARKGREMRHRCAPVLVCIYHTVPSQKTVRLRVVGPPRPFVASALLSPAATAHSGTYSG